MKWCLGYKPMTPSLWKKTAFAVGSQKWRKTSWGVVQKEMTTNDHAIDTLPINETCQTQSFQGLLLGYSYWSFVSRIPQTSHIQLAQTAAGHQPDASQPSKQEIQWDQIRTFAGCRRAPFLRGKRSFLNVSEAFLIQTCHGTYKYSEYSWYV